MGKTENKEKSVIVLNAMYSGGYLNENMGHEIINLFKSDKAIMIGGKSYQNFLYLNPYGNFNQTYEDVVTDMLMVISVPKKNMFEIVGKVNTAICYAKVVEEEAIEQIRRMCDYEFTAGSRIRIMPDVHAGKGCTIGTTMTVHDKAVPNIVGVDIGCGMYTVCLGDQEIDLVKLDEAPMAYKSLEDIIDVIKESVDVIDILKPIYNFNAG